MSRQRVLGVVVGVLLALTEARRARSETGSGRAIGTCEIDRGIDIETLAPTRDCSSYDSGIYGGLVSAALLGGIGIPLLVIGAKGEPVRSAALAPWVSRRGLGVGLRLAL